MPYVTSIERLAKEDGLAEGLQLGIVQGREQAFKSCIRTLLEARFGDIGLALFPEIDAITDDKQLDAIQKQAAVAASLDELRKLWN